MQRNSLIHHGNDMGARGPAKFAGPTASAMKCELPSERHKAALFPFDRRQEID